MMSEKIQRDLLVQDTRQLSNIIESAHPDPYINGGGKISYHHRLQKTINTIPEEGMNKQEFADHLLPFLAAIEDGHTGIMLLQSKIDRANPGGLPIFFQPIEEKLYVYSVAREEDAHLIGSLLVSIEDIGFDELVSRAKNTIFHENLYDLLRIVGHFGALKIEHFLRMLVPEWTDGEKIRVRLRHPDGKEKEYTFTKAMNLTASPIEPKSTVELPTSRGDLSYSFIDSGKNIGYLRIDGMESYREAFEVTFSIGLKQLTDNVKRVYKMYNDDEVPDDIDEVLAGIPSVTEMFLSMLREMKKTGSDSLIVDLRKCMGGYDQIIAILLYYLVGFEKTIPLFAQRREIQKLSEFVEMSGVNEYDFSWDSTFTPLKTRHEQIKSDLLKEFELIPTFFKEFRSRMHEAFYLPKKIVVLSSFVTGSSGFDMMMNLKRIGAITVGIPPRQSGNHFGNVRQFHLDNTGIMGWVSTKYFVAFPDLPEKHLIHQPDYPLSYEKLASYNFDPEAILRYALEIVEDL
jgi:hypothetical protein